jgi:hypothetical protein
MLALVLPPPALGYHVSLNRDYGRYDVVRTIEAALELHRARVFTLPGVGCPWRIPVGQAAGVRLGDLAVVQARQRPGHLVQEVIGCFIDAGQ